MTHPGDWAVLSLGLGLVFYTMKAVKREFRSFSSTCIHYQLAPLELSFPVWWEINVQDSHHISFFQKKVTDWKLSISHIIPSEDISLHQIFLQHLKEWELELDTCECTVSEKHCVGDFFLNPIFNQGILETLRVEGRGTEKGEERIYADVFFLRHRNISGLVLFRFQSAVLSGMRDGPYFEQMLKTIKIIDR